ncbi:glycosyltransferase involved in cell wall biosynthesis [Friedmanniella endophytica]|uniref:Glycosyltransferase involved in cell wall biosynthesis n=1 Tax=Microlunatus kandeliicorticis TaxID=1759536 RepID=A0A7W3IQA1_9ACTN|nr:glycosyltransferase [Microlunatus kandeliicorticis]MBA8793240.1 glycosyltransferase involved in cell wall biosynthesis [Microlunatus kandeliicorticis]
MTTAPPHRWVVVADSPFLPASGGGEREHEGFVAAAVAEGLVAALVVPVDDPPVADGPDYDLDAIDALVAPAPVIRTPRRRSALAALSLRTPYVVASRPVPADLVDRVRTAVPDADAVVVFSHKVSRLGQTLAEGLGVPAVLRHHNLEGPYHRALAAASRPPKSWVIGLEARRIDADERRLERSSWLTGIADISSADAQVRAARSRVPVASVPSFAAGSVTRPEEAARRRDPVPTVVFVGALDVLTNHDAVRWFAEQVWPAVRDRGPDGVRWQVVGRRPTEEVRRLVAATPGAELHPDVPDPAEYLRGAWVAVNPAVSGSGVNIKLVEYLALGVPVVSTRRGMAGIGLDPGADLEVRDDPAAFADAVLGLLADPKAADRLGAAGQTTAGRILDVRASLRALAELLTG